LIKILHHPDDGQYERQTKRDGESKTRPRTTGEPDGVKEGQKGGRDVPVIYGSCVRRSAAPRALQHRTSSRQTESYVNMGVPDEAYWAGSRHVPNLSPIKLVHGKRSPTLIKMSDRTEGRCGRAAGRGGQWGP
jgi:hypothetical protein